MTPLLNSERTSKEYVIISITLAGTLGILPFTVHRILTGEWNVAILNIITQLTMFSIFFYVYRTRKTSTASWILAALFLSTEFLSVTFKGASQLYWCFPGTVGVYYLIPTSRALILNLVALTIITAQVYDSMSGAECGAFAISLATTNCFIVIFAFRNQIQKQQLEELTLRDPLTGVLNRRAFDIFLETFDKPKEEPNKHAALIMLDIDHFKNINDQHGHLVGDNVLAQLVVLLKTQLHHDEKLYRIGGEEFVIAPINMNIEECFSFADRLRKIIEHSSINEQVGITVSAGVSEINVNETPKSWLGRADTALYEAKVAGRNLTRQAAPCPH